MTISSASTYEEIEDEFLDTLYYEQEASVDKAWRHAAACRALRLRRPNVATKGSNSVSFSAEDLAKAEKDAQSYARSAAAASAGGSSFVRADLGSLRDHG